jgi:hypothetical protein
MLLLLNLVKNFNVGISKYVFFLPVLNDAAIFGTNI